MIKPEPIAFSEAERLSRIFDAENREEWQRTSHILRVLDLRPQTAIADVGAGTGYFSRLFADRAPEGRVYALDAEPNMVAFMQRRFANEARANIEVRQSRHDDPCLPPGLDVVFLANVYRFIRERRPFLARLRQQVDADTRLMFVDLKHAQAQVSPQQAAAEVEAAGFRVASLDLTGCPDHYILQFAV
ncbi:class I SAM-dependent methyltransferase [Brenneria populi subsp. brevivirga]|uniref:class I SAM-dependent methyltransferase n=1 Tax=Brenneria populi TaxID=1505588 RepID=UPI002E182254|nr:class I SAM-dependent methyltransferase [Brenneria populi subsp. brevivirga]